MASLTQSFQWNIRNSITNTQFFDWGVGDAALHWYRIELKNTDSCDGAPSEVLTVMATSIEHLCSRLKQCGNYLVSSKKFQRIQRWTQPALCCDITSPMPVCNTLQDVSFCLCECISWIQPPQCKGNPPCTSQIIISTEISFSPFDMVDLSADDSGTLVDSFQMRPAEETMQAVQSTVLTYCGGKIPGRLKLVHNFGNPFKGFLERSGLANEDIILVHDGNFWNWSRHYDGWDVSFVLDCTDESGNFCWSFYAHVVRHVGNRKQNTKIAIDFTAPVAEGDNFGFVLNTNSISSGIILTPLGEVRSRNIQDGIGILNSGFRISVGKNILR